MDKSAAPPHLRNVPARILVIYTAFLLLDVLLMEEYGVDWDKFDDNCCDIDYLKGLDDIDWDENWSEISDNCAAFVVSFRPIGHPLKHQTAPLVLLHVTMVPESAVAVLLNQPLQMEMTLLPSLVVLLHAGPNASAAM